MKRLSVIFALLLLSVAAHGASDDFSATNDPLASPWTTVSGADDLQSTTGWCQMSSMASESAMVYTSSSELYSELVWAEDNIGGAGAGDWIGPALFDPATGNGYFWQPSGSTIVFVEYTGFAYNTDNGGTSFTVVEGDVMAIEIQGDDIVAFVNDVERMRWTRTEHRTGLKPGMWIGQPAVAADDWTDGAGGGGSAVVPIVHQQMSNLPEPANDDQFKIYANAR